MAVTIQLLDSDIDLGVMDEASVDGTEASLADQEGSAEAAGGGFEVGEGEESKVVGTALGEEVVESEGIGEVPSD